MTSEGISATDIVARAATTRPFRIPGETWTTRLTREALEGIIDQVTKGFVPMNVEHLDYLPPVGRWHGGTLIGCEDGETELQLRGRMLPQYLPSGDDPPDPTNRVSSLAAGGMPAEGMELHLELRNFTGEVQEELRQTAPFPLIEENRWSILPPLLWTLSIPVTWGAIKFTGAFFEELGKISADKFVSWLKRMWSKAEETNRDRILAFQFTLPNGGFITAFAFAGCDDPEPDAGLGAALDRLGEVASVAGIQNKENLFPGLKRAAYIFDKGEWHLAWWTDGDAVIRTHWFDSNMPDAERFLGHPILDLPDPPDQHAI